MTKHKFSLRKIGQFFKTSFLAWKGKDPFKESAVIAYYAIFSLPGLLLIVVTLAGYFFGAEAVSGHLSGEISKAMGEETSEEIESIIANSALSGKSAVATIIGVLTLAFGATGVFAEFQRALNNIWEVKTDVKKAGIMHTLRVRLFSLGLVVTIAFLLLVSLVVTAALSSVGEWASQSWPDALMVLFNILNFIVALAIIGLLFALMFKVLPDAKIKWRHVWIGGLVTSLLFQLGKTGLAFYFGKADPASGYGAAGSVILIMLWVSYTSMIVLYGAEFTKAVAFREGAPAPTKTAVRDPKAHEMNKVPKEKGLIGKIFSTK